MTIFFRCLKLVYGGLRVTKEVEYMNKMRKLLVVVVSMIEGHHTFTEKHQKSIKLSTGHLEL